MAGMTSRERWLALLAGQKADRIPTDYWGTWEVTRRLMSDLGCPTRDALLENLNIDAPRPIHPKPTVAHHPDDAQADLWGVRFQRVNYGPGQYDEAVHHPLASAACAEDIHAFHWPRPDNQDWPAFAAAIAAAPADRPVQCCHYEPFLLYCRMRGMEQAMMDLLTEPEIAEAALTHIFDYHYAVAERAFDIGRGRIDLTGLAEDLGSQTGLLMSLDLIRRFILPNQKRMADLAREHGIHIFYHTDGAVRQVVGDLIAVTGIEILNPIQWRCPCMERSALVRDFGGKIVFHGGIDNQRTLPFGSPADVRREVLESIEIFRPARWICAPCHAIQPNTPTENIVTMYQAIHEHGQ